jgi:hypothetical protein
MSPCAVRRCLVEWRSENFASGLPQQGGEAAGGLIWAMPGGREQLVGPSAPNKDNLRAPATRICPQSLGKYSAFGRSLTGVSWTRVLTLRSRPTVSWAARRRPILTAHDVHRATCSLGRGGIARLGLSMRYHLARAATLAPRSGLNDLITLQNSWSGAGRTADLRF